MGLLIFSFLTIIASAQMSESPVGKHYVDSAPDLSEIPDQPDIKQTRGPVRVFTLKDFPAEEAKPQPKPVVAAKIEKPQARPIAALKPKIKPVVIAKPTRAPAAVAIARVPVPAPTSVSMKAAPAQEPVVAKTPVTQVPQIRRRIAANTMTNEAYVPRVRTTVTPSKESRGRRTNWMFSGFYNLAKETEYSGNTAVQGSDTSYSATENSSSGLGVATSYIYRPPSGFGFTGQVGFEYGRTATSLTGNAGGRSLTSDYGAGYTTNMFTGAGNGTFSFDRYYIYGGLNYPYIMGSNNVDLVGLPGYQAGAGASLTRHLGLHFEYRMIRMKGALNMSPTRLEVEEARMPGFILSVDYSL